MSRTIRITAGTVQAEAVLNDSPTAAKIWDALPLEIRGNTWGDEIYFSIPVKLPEEHPKAVVALGDLGYWPPGSAFCIFFGRTPASRGDEIRPASPVNIIGRVKSDAKVFSSVADGETVVIEKV